MKLFLSTAEKTNIRNFMRSCGYAELRDQRTNAVSYAKSLSGRAYPRFHAYLDERGKQLIVNLHLDQKQASYEGHTAHSGEYDGELVEREGERIKEAWQKSLPINNSGVLKKQETPKKSFFRKLLGF